MSHELYNSKVRAKGNDVATVSNSHIVKLNLNRMEVITIESSAFQQMMEKLDSLIKNANAKSSINLSEEWMSGKEVMSLIGITSRTLQTYRDSGLLGFTQIGRKKIFYKRADVEQLLNKNYLKSFKNGK